MTLFTTWDILLITEAVDLWINWMDGVQTKGSFLMTMVYLNIVWAFLGRCDKSLCIQTGHL